MSEKQTRDRMAIEAALAGDAPGSGFELLRRVGPAPAEFEPSLYPTLHRLEADGRVVARWEATPAGMRRRYRRSRLARLTPIGH